MVLMKTIPGLKTVMLLITDNNNLEVSFSLVADKEREERGGGEEHCFHFQ